MCPVSMMSSPAPRAPSQYTYVSQYHVVVSEMGLALTEQHVPILERLEVDADRLDLCLARRLHAAVRLDPYEVEGEGGLRRVAQREPPQSVAQVGKELVAALEDAEHVHARPAAVEAVVIADVVGELVNPVHDHAVWEHHAVEVVGVVIWDDEVAEWEGEVVGHVERRLVALADVAGHGARRSGPSRGRNPVAEISKL